MLFLWYVSVLLVFPVLRSQKRIVLSYDPVITWGSALCDMMDATVLSCPDRQYTCDLVRMSCGGGGKGVCRRVAGQSFSTCAHFALVCASQGVRGCARWLWGGSGRLLPVSTAHPDAAGGVAAAGHEEIEPRVERHRVHAAQVAVVVANHLLARRAHTGALDSRSRRVVLGVGERPRLGGPQRAEIAPCCTRDPSTSPSCPDRQRRGTGSGR